MTFPQTFPFVCHRCCTELTPGEGSLYVVRIEAFSDPTPPADVPGETLEDVSAEIDRLLEQTRHMSEQELMDQVYRRVILFLCFPCYEKWIENPTG